jgi:hypothetical protein
MTINWEVQDDSVPPGGPYRKIVAKSAVADPGVGEEHGSQQEIEPSTSGDLGDLDYIPDGLAKLPSLRAVYLSSGFEPCWDTKLAHVLAMVEAKRDTAEGSTLGTGGL